MIQFPIVQYGSLFGLRRLFLGFKFERERIGEQDETKNGKFAFFKQKLVRIFLGLAAPCWLFRLMSWCAVFHGLWIKLCSGRFWEESSPIKSLHRWIEVRLPDWEVNYSKMCSHRSKNSFLSKFGIDWWHTQVRRDQRFFLICNSEIPTFKSNVLDASKPWLLRRFFIKNFKILKFC